jgi:GxxExxY protein
LGIIYEEESYKIIGALYKTFRDLGPSVREKDIQTYLVALLKEEGFDVKEQVLVKLMQNNNLVRRYYLDLLINDKIILEIKKGQYNPDFFQQVKIYLKTTGLKLGLLGIFTKNKVIPKRIPNIL